MSPFWPQGKPVPAGMAGDAPARFSWQGQTHRVRDVSLHWRIHTEWWAGREIWRDYWEVTTDSGFLCVLFQDRSSGEVFLERVLA